MALAPKMTNKTLVNSVLRHLSKLQVREWLTLCGVGAIVGQGLSGLLESQHA